VQETGGNSNAVRRGGSSVENRFERNLKGGEESVFCPFYGWKEQEGKGTKRREKWLPEGGGGPLA